MPMRHFGAHGNHPGTLGFFPNIHLEIRLQHPLFPQTAEQPLQYYQNQRGLGNQHSFSHSLIPFIPNRLMTAAQSIK